MRRPALPASLLGALLLLALPAAGQGTQQACPGAPEPVLFAEWESSLENLAFDGAGHLYVADVGGGRIVRFTPDGGSSVALEGEVHGLAWGPDGRLYTTVAAGEEAWDVRRSTDESATAFEPYASGLPTYNGMAFDAAGNLYVSDDSVGPPNDAPDLVRVPASDPTGWAPWTDLYGPNGLAFDARTGWMYTVITADQASPVVRLSTADPALHEAVAYLSYGVATLQPGQHDPQGDPLVPLPKGLDDLALGPDRLLYIAAHLSGELLRVDPATGTACVLAAGLEEPTSVRVAHGFGPHGGKLFVTTWGGTGVTGLALGQLGEHPAGKVWMLDVGFVEEPATGVVSAPGSPEASTSPATSAPDEAGPGPGRDTPLAPAALLALALAVAALGRRR